MSDSFERLGIDHASEPIKPKAMTDLKAMTTEEIVRLRKQLKAELNLRRLQPEGQLPAAIGSHVFFSRGVAHSSSAGSSEPLCKVCGEDKDYSAHSELTAGILGFHHFEPQAGCCGKTRGAGEHSDDYLKMHTFRPVAGQTNVPQMGQPRDYGDCHFAEVALLAGLYADKQDGDISVLSRAVLSLLARGPQMGVAEQPWTLDNTRCSQ